MIKSLKLFTISALTLLTLQVSIAAPKQFIWQTLSGFDGSTYRGLAFDESTDSFIKRVFQSQKGAYRPEGFILKTTDPNLERVEVLLNGRGGKAVMTALRISPSRILNLDLLDIEQQLGVTGIESYSEGRFSDWAVAKFPDHGVIVLYEFTLSRTERNRRITSIILTTKSRSSFLDKLQEEPTPIDSLERLLETLERRIFVSGVNLDISSAKIRNLRGRDENDLEFSAEREISNKRFVAGNEGGEIDVTVNIDKRGNVNVSANLNSYNGIGRLSISGSASCKLKVDADGYVYYSHFRVQDAVEDAVKNLGNSADYAIRRQRAPSEASLMQKDWDSLTDFWTKK